MINKNCETRATLWVPETAAHGPLTCCFAGGGGPA